MWYSGQSKGIAFITFETEDGDPSAAGDDCIDGDAATDWANGAGKAPADVNPGVEEVYYDGTDDDCDQEATGDCDFDGDGFRADPTATTLADSACDFGAEERIDCNDEDASVQPTDDDEVFYNGKDDNCDYADLDGDIDGDGYFVHDYLDRLAAAGLEVDTATVTLPDLAVDFDCWDADTDDDATLGYAAADVPWPGDAPDDFVGMSPLAGFSALAAEGLAEEHDCRRRRPRPDPQPLPQAAHGGPEPGPRAQGDQQRLGRAAGRLRHRQDRDRAIARSIRRGRHHRLRRLR